MPLLLILLLLACLLPNAADARVYRYGALTLEANTVTMDRSRQIIEISGGFKGNYESYALAGDYFRINKATGNFSGQNMRIDYLTAYLKTADLQFYGDKLDLKGITVSPLDQPVFSANLGQLEIYPGYWLARHSVPKLFFVPFYYIPLYFNDQRRSYFPLPVPALEAGQDIYHGTAAALHSHYFLNERSFGDLALRYSENDGAGLGVQQIVRLSDQQQLSANGVGWQKSPAQLKLSYVFNYFKSPPPPDHHLNFQEQSEAIQQIARAEPLFEVRGDYSQNEDLSRGRIDRYPDVSANARLKGILFDHAYILTPYLTFGQIREKRIFPENGAPQDVNRDFGRQGVGFDCSYFLETPYIKPYVNRALLSLDYLHNNYSPGTAKRDRLASSLTIRRPLFNLTSLNYELILTKVLLNTGQSPFFFEEYGWQLQDNAAFDLYLQSDKLIGGGKFIYDLANGAPYNEIYYFGIKALGDSYAVIRRNRRMQLWEFAIMRKDLAF